MDERTIENIRKGKGRVIDSQDQVGGWDPYPEIHRPEGWDTDGDGMPDAWEKSHGFDPNNPADGNKDADGDGYTNLEEYLNSLVPNMIEVTRTHAGLQGRDATLSVGGAQTADLDVRPGQENLVAVRVQPFQVEHSMRCTPADLHTGWFAGRMALEFTAGQQITDVFAFTREIGPPAKVEVRPQCRCSTSRSRISPMSAPLTSRPCMTMMSVMIHAVRSAPRPSPAQKMNVCVVAFVEGGNLCFIKGDTMVVLPEQLP